MLSGKTTNFHSDQPLLAVVSYNLHRLGSSLLEAQRKKERRVAKKAA